MDPNRAIISDLGWVVGPIILFLMAFTVWCWGVLAGFDAHRDGLTRRLAWLSEIQGVQSRLAHAEGSGAEVDIEPLLYFLSGLGESIRDIEGPHVLEAEQVLQDIEVYRGSFGAPASVQSLHLEALSISLARMAYTLQERCKEDSEALDARWGSLYVLAMAAIALAISNIVGLCHIWTQGQRLRSSSKTLETASSRDLLTGLLNRRESMRQARHLLEEARHREAPLALCLVELDRFAAVNEVHGYFVGDEAIRIAAKRILASVRVGDPVGRVGGDEFIVLLAGCHRMEAQRVAERIRRSFEDEEEMGSVVLRTTASVGAVVVHPQGTQSIDSLMKIASQSLTQAKMEGRNRVRIQEIAAPDEETSPKAEVAQPAAIPIHSPRPGTPPAPKGDMGVTLA